MFALALTAASSNAFSAMKDANIKFAFQKYIATYNKSYQTIEEYEARFENFAKTHAQIEEIRAQNGTSKVGHNKFSDISQEEKDQLLSYRPRTNEDGTLYSSGYELLNTNDLPSEVNWVTAGKMNPV